MIELIYTIAITVAFCLGWRIITDKGNLLYFIRKPFEQMYENLEMNEELYARYKNPAVFNRIYKLKRKIFFAKPFVLCITCFGSLWGAAVFVTLNGISIAQIPYLIINSIAASFIQTYVWVKYEKLNQ